MQEKMPLSLRVLAPISGGLQFSAAGILAITLSNRNAFGATVGAHATNLDTSMFMFPAITLSELIKETLLQSDSKISKYVGKILPVVSVLVISGLNLIAESGLFNQEFSTFAQNPELLGDLAFGTIGILIGLSAGLSFLKYFKHTLALQR